MKRVQAIVTGRKKQCTKLPTPAQKGKKSESPQQEDKCLEAGIKDAAGAGGGGSRKLSSTGSRASSASSTITAGSSSNVSTISAASSPSVRGMSKIPASSPKKGSKDGSGATSPSKGRLRLDSDGKSKSKQKSEQSSRKSSTKDKQKGDQKRKKSDPAVPSVNAGGKSQQTRSDNDDAGFIRQNVYAEDSRDVASTSQRSHDSRALPAAPLQTQSQPDSVEGRDPHNPKPQPLTNPDPRYQVSAKTDPRLLKDPRMASREQVRQDASRQAHSLSGQGHQPLHGILKDTGSNGSSHASMDYYQSLGDPYSNGVSGQHREIPYGLRPQPPSRTSSIRGSTEPLYQQGYGSLPRSSRSTTPTPENPYSYGSLPRRSTARTPTAQNAMYYNSNGQSWGSLTRKAESDSGFPTGSLERGYSNNTYAIINYSNPNAEIQGYSNKMYAAVNRNYQPPRPGSVPPPGSDSTDSVYSVARPGSVPPHYYSDTEAAARGGGYYQGTGRAGSVPLGYESESGIYGVAGPIRLGGACGYESESAYDAPTSGLRTRPEDEQYRAGPGKRPVPRRHTVGTPNNTGGKKDQETERKREAFMQLLAQRYPQYADKIQGVGASPPPTAPQLDKPARARDGQRRRTAVVNYDPAQAAHTLEYDDLGTMSDLELPSFQRGGLMRTSLPIVRSASTSLERPLGLVFLVYGDQTKKSLLPNEITSLDTVRALFVRAFPDLTLEMLETPRKKIYLLDPATSIYFQLEDLAEIKDRSVLKIHETDSDEPQKVKERQEVRGRTVQMPATRIHPRQVYGDLPAGHGEGFVKSQSLPPQSAHYPEVMQDQRNQWEVERRSRSRTPEPAERPRSLSAGAANRQRFSHSPDRLPTPERGSLNPIPENRQLPPGYRDSGNYYETVHPPGHRGPYSSGIYETPAVVYQGYPPASPIPGQQTYVARSTRAPPMAHPQRAIAPGPDMRDSGRGNNPNRHSLAFTPMSLAAAADGGYQRSQSYRVPPTEREGTDLARSHSMAPADERNRIEKMEQQLANLTAWVHYQKADGARREVAPPPRSLGSTTSDSSDTFPASSASKHIGETPSLSTITTSTNHVVRSQGLSDIPDGHPPQVSSGLSSRESTPLSAQAEVSVKLAQLKSDLHVLRRQQQLYMEAMKDEFMATFAQIKKVFATVPGADNQVNFHKRTEATTAKTSYVNDKKQVDKELSDLEASVEELRNDVISRQCRVNTSDVEGMALLLSTITKSLADLKARFPDVHHQMKHVMDAEMRVVVSEEKFLKEEPTEIENSLKRCKKLTGTLYTLKRLASVQDHRPPHVPNLTSATEAPISEQKDALLESIRALVPDHDQRVKEMEAADASRERKKKISSQQEALKFGKSLEMASKNLRPPSLSGDKIPDIVPGSEQITKETDSDGTGPVQPSQNKPAVPAKPILSTAAAASTHTSTPVTVSSAPSTATASNVASVKPSFSSALTTAKPSDKPTATVSAMTASVSDTVTTTATKTVEKEPGSVATKSVTMPLAYSTVHGGMGNVTQTVKVGTEAPKKKDASIYNYQVCGPVNPVFPVQPPVFTKPDNLTGASSYKASSPEKVGTVSPAKSKSDSVPANPKKPADLSLSRTETHKKASVSFSDPPVTSPTNGDVSSHNGHEGAEKVDLATQKHAARTAFFSSMNSPPSSPSQTSPKSNSASLDPGPVISPGPGMVGKVTPGPTINLVLSGSAIPKSPTSPGSFTICPPVDIACPVAEAKPSSPLNSPTRGIPRLVSDSKPTSDVPPPAAPAETGNKPKKVPPPPPPRRGSRPTSANISPVNGGPPDAVSTQQSQEGPKFIGGVLGQHRLSGGPMSSTPKPVSQQKPVSRFETDIASGIYANMNRPDVQNQKSSPKQMITQANTAGARQKDTSQSPQFQKESSPIPPPPAVTIALDREERGSSSESTSSSSGTSMGSQQSVISVVRSSSVNVKTGSKPKPEPPKRQSSLLAKFTGSKDSKSKLNNGKAKMNGVDL